MRYMLMICDDESDERGPLELVRDTEHLAWIDYLNREEIRLLDGVRLRPSTDATKVRSRNGETLISDGPFMESKEQIGGFALIECEHILSHSIVDRDGASGIVIKVCLQIF